jgi:TetR/AcrR family tetracycline transcriptional repressor
MIHTLSMARLGRPPTISRDAVIAEALRGARRRGFAALTIRSVAGGLGVAPMALYRHVRDKRELLEAVADAAVAEVELPLRRSGDDPMVALATLGRRLRAVLNRYPGAAAHVLARGPLWPSALRVTEWSLRALRDAGYDAPGAARASVAFADYVIGRARLESEGVPDFGSLLGSLDGGEYPLLVESGEALRVQDADDQFEYGLGRLIDGLRAELGASSVRSGA